MNSATNHNTQTSYRKRSLDIHASPSNSKLSLSHTPTPTPTPASAPSHKIITPKSHLSLVYPPFLPQPIRHPPSTNPTQVHYPLHPTPSFSHLHTSSLNNPKTRDTIIPKRVVEAKVTYISAHIVLVSTGSRKEHLEVVWAQNK